MEPLVSIVVPNFNKGKYLEDTLKSLISQTHKNIEIIIVDDGSTDNSLEILKRYDKVDTRIKVYFNEHLGKVRSINYGMTMVKGDFVKLWGSDDYMQEYVVEKLLNEVGNAGVVAHNCLLTDENLSIINNNFIDFSEYEGKIISLEDIIEGKGFPSGLYFMRTEVANLIFPLDTNIPYEDWYMYMFLNMNNIDLKYVDTPLGMYRQVSDGAFGGVNNFDKHITRYRNERDIKMLEYFLDLLPAEYSSLIKRRISLLTLSTKGNLLEILTSDHSIDMKSRIIIKRYFFMIYYIITKLKNRGI